MSKSSNVITYLDLFAGAGGLSEGFASIGYKPIAHVEMDRNACNTLKTRESFYYLKSVGQNDKYNDYLKGYISREQLYDFVPKNVLDSVICDIMSDDSMPAIFRKIDDLIEIENIKKIDLILGGPPCQAYSMVGRARKNMSDDPRNSLYKLYIQALKKYEPPVFVFENVLGLLSAGEGAYFKDIKARFRELGYKTGYQILNAAEYGVLQNRKRIILIGWKEGSNHRYPELKKWETNYLVSEIFADLPPLAPGQANNNYSGNISKYLKEANIRGDDDVLTWHICRPNLERDREIYRYAIRLWENGHKRLKYTDLPDKLATHNNKASFLDRFKVIASDLPASHTMVAHIAKDGHYYIHPDLNQARSISVREAARIQSFPDNYYFEGSRTSVFKQIGNAVPPLLANAIAKELLEQFLQEN